MGHGRRRGVFVMAVYEIKNPVQAPLVPKRSVERITEPVDEINHLVRINQFRQFWEKSREKGERQEYRPTMSPATEQTANRLIQQLNEDLERHHIAVHLTLSAAPEGFFLEIYDCTDTHACYIVGDLFIPEHDLPLFVRSLQQEAGIIVDRIS